MSPTVMCGKLKPWLMHGKPRPYCAAISLCKSWTAGFSSSQLSGTRLCLLAFQLMWRHTWKVIGQLIVPAPVCQMATAEQHSVSQWSQCLSNCSTGFKLLGTVGDWTPLTPNGNPVDSTLLTQYHKGYRLEVEPFMDSGQDIIRT